MPVENEFKYVLVDDDGRLRRTLRSRRGVKMQRIEQSYLTKGVRIRQTEDLATGALSWDLTFKRKAGRHVVEIETGISREDYRRLLPTREEGLVKTRFKLLDAGILWDVDYFGALKAPYFVMAEAELPQELWDSRAVPEPAAALADFVLHVVGKDGGFSSRRMCDERYAVKMMKVLRAARDQSLAESRGEIGMACV